MWLVSFVQNCEKDQAHSPGPWCGPKIVRGSFQPFDLTTEAAAAGIALRYKRQQPINRYKSDTTAQSIAD
jgi:hypothetical protein